MKIKCSGCKKNINIKDGSYPKERSFSFLCPGCGKKIKINPIKKPKLSVDTKSEVNLFRNKLQKEILENNPSLPPTPDIFIKAKKLIKANGYSTKELSSLISLDQAIAARVLKLANSAYFNFNPPVPSIDEACLLLGEKNLISIILVAQMSKMLDKELKGYKISAEDFFYHSVATATAAELIAYEKMPLFHLDAFSAGLLHDCGKLVLNDYLIKEKEKFKSLIIEKKLSPWAAEKQIFGFSHSEIGLKLLESWQLPKIQTQAIGFHHNPMDSLSNELSYILNAADFLSKKAGFSAENNWNNNLFYLSDEVKVFLKIEDYELEEFSEKIRENVLIMTKDFNF
ncbi:MAG: HDOD domain-containing protein [Desulforegulaceae bacterium]|nr:HDOD domain-containing protein [Desulforegulaceae bacterium]